MTNYNLGVLNDKEFENLVKDLLELELKVKFQNFAKGPDGGIDLRFSTTRENKIIVQAKHYWKSKYTNLKNDVKKEKSKITKLKPKPKRYIFVTSMSLSPPQTTEIHKLLKPFTKSTNDIYSYDRINSMIGKYGEVEKKYYKLWITSTSILERIINNGIRGKSEFFEEKILKKVKRYVPTNDYGRATTKLKRERFIIITGEPGIGKTTIAYLLICELLAKRYQLVYIDNRISEAENILSPDPKKKQVFFFDDFLGSNLHSIANPSNNESTIVNFVERIKNEKNKLLILTTRTTILKQAEHSFEKLSRSKISTISRYEIEINSYSRLNKAKILYNHLYHSNLKQSDISKILIEKFYLKIIDHKNYSPRLIEFITEENNFKQDSEGDYIDFIENSLSNPQEIWKGVFEHQLSDADRFLLVTLYSLGGYRVSSGLLEEAFNARIKYEIEFGGHVRENNSFNNSLKKLLDGLIRSERNEQEHINLFSYINPSVGDFLINYLSQNRSELSRLILSSIFVEQLNKNIYLLHNSSFDQASKIIESESENYYQFFKKSCFKLKAAIKGRYMNIEILKIYLDKFDGNFIEEELIPWVNNLRPEEIKYQLSSTIKVVGQLEQYTSCREVIIEKWEAIIKQLYALAEDQSDYNDIKTLFDIYDIDFKRFHSKEDNNEFVTECLGNIFSDNIRHNLDISFRTKEKIVELIERDERESADSLIDELINDEYSSFLRDMGMHNFAGNTLSIDPSSIVDKIYDEMTTSNDDFESRIERKVIEKGHTSEQTEIFRLFEG